MQERLQCEFSLIRYVPDVVKGEFANIGVVLREAGRQDTAAVRFTRDWSRVRCLDPEADVELLESLEAEMAARLQHGAEPPILTRPLLATLEDSLSNSVQLTEMRGTLAENLATEMDQLLRLYVEPLRMKADRRKPTGRAAIAGGLRDAFERAGVWRLMRKRIAAAQYTQAGDPLKIDCGYRISPAGLAGGAASPAVLSQEERLPGVFSPIPSAGEMPYRNGRVRMFQAVSLENDAEGAKGLAYSAEGLRKGVGRMEGAELELTAVVESIATVADQEQYGFGVDVMERERIRVLTVADLGRVAETARRELRG